MKRVTALLTVIAFCGLSTTANAFWSVSNEGTWPKSWPAELETLRAQSRTRVGGLISLEVHQIPFTRRGEFEAAWPHLLKTKTQGAPIILVRGPKEGFFSLKPAGVIIHAPPRNSKAPAQPIAGVQNTRERWMMTTYIELVVDGLVVDLNRIQLPPDTPIIDERFNSDKDGTTKKLPEPRNRPDDD